MPGLTLFQYKLPALLRITVYAPYSKELPIHACMHSLLHCVQGMCSTSSSDEIIVSNPDFMVTIRGILYPFLYSWVLHTIRHSFANVFDSTPPAVVIRMDMVSILYSGKLWQGF